MNADKIVAYMLSNGTKNVDRLDGWNDRRLLLTFNNGWRCIFNTSATTEPGAQATFSVEAAKRNGVARIAIGQHLEAWKIGFHKSKQYHPALIHCAPVSVYRDKNRDGLRTGDTVYTGLFGINQHGCPNATPKNVGVWSEGCLVGQAWGMHLMFMTWLNRDPRVVDNPDFRFDTTIIDGNDFHNFKF
jgi:hypothetical protein